jgi:L-asparaginase II
MSEVLLHYTRGGKVECIHRGDMVAVDTKGKIIDSVGNGRLDMFWRSAAKPFQAMPFVKAGGVEKYGLTEEELAFLVSSHSGEDLHVNLAKSVLAKIGLDESYLNCGAARPMSGKAAKTLTENKMKPSALHNPCSGKHSGMLALCRMLSLDTDGYIEPSHEVQKIMHESVANAARLKKEEIEIGIDGCGVPVFYLPIYNMALAYARLAKPENGEWGEYENAAVKIKNAMLNHPKAVSGTGRIDAALAEITNGRILAKIGADAVYCLASVPDGIGVTFKIEDGSYRAINPAVIGTLKRLDLISKSEHEKLLELYPPILKNHRGDVIGTIETVF